MCGDARTEKTDVSMKVPASAARPHQEWRALTRPPPAA